MSGFAVAKYYGLYQGLPAASGTLNVYQTGTTTPVTCYSDAGLTVPISNPITLDANGCAAFYYSGSVNLKFVSYTQSGTLIETLDPIYPTGGATTGTTIKVSANISIMATNAANNLVSTTAVNYTLPLTTSLSTSFNFNANAQGGAITLVPQSSDAIAGGSAGANYIIPISASTEVWTDANGNWGLNFISLPTATLAQSPNKIFAGPSSGSSAATPTFRSLVSADLPFPYSPTMNVLSSDVTMSSTASYYDGPSVATVSSGSYIAAGTVSVLDTAGNAVMDAKLWDGTTVIASCTSQTLQANAPIAMSLAGYLANPAGNLRISVKDATAGSGKIKANASGGGADSTIVVFRLS